MVRHQPSGWQELTPGQAVLFRQSFCYNDCLETILRAQYKEDVWLCNKASLAVRAARHEAIEMPRPGDQGEGGAVSPKTTLRDVVGFPCQALENLRSTRWPVYDLREMALSQDPSDQHMPSPLSNPRDRSPPAFLACTIAQRLDPTPKRGNSKPRRRFTPRNSTHMYGDMLIPSNIRLMFTAEKNVGLSVTAVRTRGLAADRSPPRKTKHHCCWNG